MPSHVGVRAISVVHCVSASTNTRSKNSSSGVTRSPSRMTALTRGTRGGCDELTGPSSHPPVPSCGYQCSDMFGSPAEFRPEPDVVHVPPLGVPASYAWVRQLRSPSCAQ